MSHQKPEKELGEQPKVHRIRITLTGRNVQSLEKVCRELKERAQSKGLTLKGPVRLPVCDSPSAHDLPPLTLIDTKPENYHALHAPTEVVKSVIVNIEAGVEVEVTIAA
ncbi:hypothetical protein B7463_g1325, partial [Scytalidium lignicola]